MRLRFRQVPAGGRAPGTRWLPRGTAQPRTLLRGWPEARGRPRSCGARAGTRLAAHLERSGRTWAGRGAGAQAREPASPLPTSPAGAHLGDSPRKRRLAAASPGNAGGPAAARQEAAAEEELKRTAHGSPQPPESPAPPPALGPGPRGQRPRPATASRRLPCPPAR